MTSTIPGVPGMPGPIGSPLPPPIAGGGSPLPDPPDAGGHAEEQEATEAGQVKVLVAVPQSARGRQKRREFVLPAQTELRIVVPDLLEVLAELGMFDPDTTKGQSTWSLARVGGEPLPLSSTLEELEVINGSLLLLEQVRTDEEFTPYIDDVQDGTAKTAAGLTQISTVSMRKLVFGAWLVSAAAIAAVICWWWITIAPTGLLLPGVGVGIGLVVAAASALAALRYRSTDVSVVLAMCAVVLTAAGAAGFVPAGIRQPATRWLVVALVVLTLASVLLAIARAAWGLAVGLVTSAALLAIAAAVMTFTAQTFPAVGGLMVVISGAGLWLTPAIAKRLAGVRVPTMPSPDDRILDAMEAARRGISSGDPDRRWVPEVPADYDARTLRTSDAVTGLLVAFAGTLVVSLWLSTQWDKPRSWAVLIVVACAVLMLLLRTRTYVRQVHAVVLVISAVALLVGVAGKVAVLAASPLVAIIAFSVVIVAMLIAAALTVMWSEEELSTPLRAALSTVENLSIFLTFVLAVWYSGFPSWVREAIG